MVDASEESRPWAPSTPRILAVVEFPFSSLTMLASPPSYDYGGGVIAFMAETQRHLADTATIGGAAGRTVQHQLTSPRRRAPHLDVSPAHTFLAQIQGLDRGLLGGKPRRQALGGAC